MLANHNNTVMGVSKRHGGHDSSGSSKWLPAVSNEKSALKAHRNGTLNTTTIQIGKGEIQITNNAQSPGPSSIKMYGQVQGHHAIPNQNQLRVTNHVG